MDEEIEKLLDTTISSYSRAFWLSCYPMQFLNNYGKQAGGSHEEVLSFVLNGPSNAIFF